MTDPTAHNLISRLADELDHDTLLPWHPLAVEARAWLAAEPPGEGPPAENGDLAQEIWDLISESEGVAGLHLNGDLAPWDELLPGGRFERLTSLKPVHSPPPTSVEPPAAGEVPELVKGLQLISDGMGALGHDSDSWLATRAAALLQQLGQPAPVPAPAEISYQFSVFDSDLLEQAGGAAPTYLQAVDEGLRYLAQYQQDGPHSLELRRVEILPLPVPTTIPRHG